MTDVRHSRELFGLDNSERWFIVALMPKLPLVGMMTTEPRGNLLVLGMPFVEGPYGDFTGFYDWLLSGDGELLGIRYFPADAQTICTAQRRAYDASMPALLSLEKLHHLRYVHVAEGGRYMTIWFCSAEQRKESVDNIIPQDFGYNRIFRTADGHTLITFHAAIPHPRMSEVNWL